MTPPRKRSRGSTPRVCQYCRATFVPKRSEYKTYCSREHAYADKSRIRAERLAAELEEKRLAEAARAPCEVCGGPVVGRRRIRCSEACDAEHYRREAREYAKTLDHRDRSPRACRCCGKVFAPEYGDKRRSECSAACRRRLARKRRKRRIGGDNHRRRARKFGVAYEIVNRTVVFERDGYVCQICGGKTARSRAGTNHPKAPTLDHRVPMARGGGHTYANLQCAHRECNWRKSANSEIGQMPLWERSIANG